MNVPLDKTRVYIALPVIVIILLAVSAFYIPFDFSLSGAASELLNFRPSRLKIMPQSIVARTTDQEGPFDFSHAKPLHVNDAPKQEQTPGTNVSLIVISGENRLAVIDGRTVRVGDSIGSVRIAKIEPDRVLLKDRSEQWLYMREER